MAGFILCRKSRDEDIEHESLNMQRDLVREYVGKDEKQNKNKKYIFFLHQFILH